MGFINLLLKERSGTGRRFTAVGGECGRLGRLANQIAGHPIMFDKRLQNNG